MQGADIYYISAPCYKYLSFLLLNKNVKELYTTRILRFGRTKFFRNNRSHAHNSLACDMPLLVPYRSRYRLFVSVEKSKILLFFCR